MAVDYGSKSGFATILCPDLPAREYTAQQTALGTFFAALKTAQLTAGNQSDVISSQKAENSSTAKPDADVNAKEKLVFAWRTGADSSVRRGTIPGISKSSTALMQTDEGDVLTSAGKTALGAALDLLYDLGTGSAIVLWGKQVEDR